MSHPIAAPTNLRAGLALDGPLGVGARGVVWAATDRNSGQPCAVKTPQRAGLVGAAVLKAEYRTLVRCQHPHIVRPHRLVQRSATCWFEMDRVDGVRITRWARSLPRTWDASVDQRFRSVAGQLVSAVQAVHACGLVHRDIKPENLLVGDADHLVLVDFDLAGPPDAEQTRGTIPGTAGYRAPEQALGLQVGPAADWYSVGAVLHELLLGQPPHGRGPRASLRAQRRRRPPDLTAVRPDIPADIAAIVRDLLHPEPTARAGASRLAAVFSVQSPLQPAITRGTLDQLQRLYTRAPAARIDLWGATATDRRQARSTSVADGRWDVLVRIDPREHLPHRALDAVAAGVVHLLRQLPRELRATVLPRDRIALLDSFPDFLLLPELSTFSSKGPTRAPRPLARVLARLALHGPLRIVLEDIHQASASDLADLAALWSHGPIGCGLVTESDRPATSLDLRAHFPERHSVQVRLAPSGV